MISAAAASPDPIRAANRMINTAAFVDEGGDVWETPIELLLHGGDCEDFAIAKYFLLLEIGVDDIVGEPVDELAIMLALRHVMRTPRPEPVLPRSSSSPLVGDGEEMQRLRATIDPVKATPSSMVKPGKPAGSESMETTHYSVVDSEGNAVAVTYTINDAFGNGITVPGLGFLLNNEMDDFSAKPGTPNMFGLVQGENNAIQPGKRPLSSMTPTILEKDGKLFMTVGAPGGSRISTAVQQVILQCLAEQNLRPRNLAANDGLRCRCDQRVGIHGSGRSRSGRIAECRLLNQSRAKSQNADRGPQAADMPQVPQRNRETHGTLLFAGCRTTGSGCCRIYSFYIFGFEYSRFRVAK